MLALLSCDPKDINNSPGLAEEIVQCSFQNAVKLNAAMIIGRLAAYNVDVCKLRHEELQQDADQAIRENSRVEYESAKQYLASLQSDSVLPQPEKPDGIEERS